MQFWLHPITVWPQCRSVQATLKIARKAGYRRLVLSPLSGWTASDYASISPRDVGAVEGPWHPLTQASWRNSDGWKRLMGRMSGDEAALPWDNLFFGHRSDVLERMLAMKRLFPDAIYSGHSPVNDGEWLGRHYVWEINPDHGIYGNDVFDVLGRFALDFHHLTRPERQPPHRRIVEPERMVEFVRELVDRRGRDIAMLHFHLAAKNVVPFALGLVSDPLRQAFRYVASCDSGYLPVAVQFMPLPPLNGHPRLSAAFLGRIRAVVESMLMVEQPRDVILQPA